MINERHSTRPRGEGGAVVVNPAYIPHYPGRGSDGQCGTRAILTRPDGFVLEVENKRVGVEEQRNSKDREGH